MDTNDITEPIPLGKSGDRLSWNHVNKIADAINKRRGSASPPRQINNTAGNSDLICAVAIAKGAALTISGSSAVIDSVSCVTDDLVFDSSTKKVYRITSTGTWKTVFDLPLVVHVAKGTLYGPITWIYDGSIYVPQVGVYST